MFNDRPTATQWINDHVQKVCKNLVRKDGMSEFNVVLNNHSGRVYDIPKQL